MKIRIPLSRTLEAEIKIAQPGRDQYLTSEISPEEYDALVNALSAQRPTITGQSWDDVIAVGEATTEPDYVGLIDLIKQTGGSVEINGVKITPCDTYGRTADEQRRVEGEAL